MHFPFNLIMSDRTHFHLHKYSTIDWVLIFNIYIHCIHGIGFFCLKFARKIMHIFAWDGKHDFGL